MKHLLLLGGGRAHLQVLAALAATPLAAARVTLVSAHTHHVYSSRVPDFLAGRCGLSDCRLALAPLAREAKALFTRASVTGLDVSARQVRLSNGETLSYDALSIGTGAAMDRDSLPGARDNALFVHPLDGFVALWDAVLELAQSQSLSLVVVGGGAAGVELALAAQLRLGERARVSLLTGGGPVLADHTPALQRRAAQLLRQRRIQVFDERCTAVQPGHVQLGSGARLACDVPLLATGGGPVPWLTESGLALDAEGRVRTGALLQSSSHPDVFAAGDVASRSDVPWPSGGSQAELAGPALALNLRRFVSGGTLQAWTPPKRQPPVLLAAGDGRALLGWGPLALHGRWAGTWKERQARDFMARFQRSGEALDRLSSADPADAADAAHTPDAPDAPGRRPTAPPLDAVDSTVPGVLHTTPGRLDD